MRRNSIQLVSIFICFICILIPSELFAWSGQVVDAQTGMPVADVVVVRGWYRRTPTVAGGMDSYLTHKETLTDTEGRFRLTKYLPSISIPILAEVHEQRTIFYKPGYQAIKLNSKPSKIMLEPVPTEYEARNRELRNANPSHPLDRSRTKHLAHTISEESQFLYAIRALEKPAKKRAPAPTKQPARQPRELPVYKRATRAEIKGWAAKLENNHFETKATRNLLAARDDAVPFILPLTEHREKRVRDVAYSILEAVGGPQVIRLLCGKARSKRQFDDVLRISNNNQLTSHSYQHSQAKEALFSLGSIRELQSFQCVLQVYLDEPDMRSAAGQAINNIGLFPADQLIKHLSHWDAKVRRDAYSWFRQSGDPRVRTILTKGLKDVDIRVRNACIYGLIQIEDPEVWPHLINQLGSENYRDREAAASFLVRYGEQSSTLVFETLKRGSVKQRWQAAWILAQINDAETLKRLMEFSRDKSPEVRLMAAYGLAHCGREESLSMLEKIQLSDRRPGIQTTAATLVDKLKKRISTSKPRTHAELTPKSPKPMPRPVRQNRQTGTTHQVKIASSSRAVNFKAPPNSAQAIFKKEWQRRGKHPIGNNDEGLYVLITDDARSYKDKYSCTDFKLSEDKIKEYFLKATESLQPSNKRLCYLSGVLRHHKKHSRWVISADGSGILFPDDDDNFDRKTSKHMECSDCQDLFP